MKKHLTLEQAAERLGLSKVALVNRCRRAATVRKDGFVIAKLAPGITAIKLGKTWLFPEEPDGSSDDGRARVA